MIGRVLRFEDADMPILSACIDQDVPWHGFCIFNTEKSVRQPVRAVVLRVSVRGLHTEPVVIGLNEVDALRTVSTVIVDPRTDHTVQPLDSFRLRMLSERDRCRLLVSGRFGILCTRFDRCRSAFGPGLLRLRLSRDRRQDERKAQKENGPESSDSLS